MERFELLGLCTISDRRFSSEILRGLPSSMVGLGAVSRRFIRNCRMAEFARLEG